MKKKLIIMVGILIVSLFILTGCMETSTTSTKKRCGSNFKYG